MTRSIKAGDKVAVRWFYPPHTTQTLVGRVVSVPAATGDMWYIEADDGEMYAINPCCSHLVWIKERTIIEEGNDGIL